jgi:sterol desaturase/sphingolipid hydroxylase (fatty acid hydroxylase superfamily)
MHIWHHEAALRGKAGVNFGIVLSVWDWLFKTAYMPLDRTPERLGFVGDDRFPDAFWRRMLIPFMDTGRYG